MSRFNRFSASADDELGFGAGFFAAAMPDPPPPRRAFSFAFWRSLRIRRSSYGSQKRGVDGEDATGLGRRGANRVREEVGGARRAPEGEIGGGGRPPRRSRAEAIEQFATHLSLPPPPGGSGRVIHRGRRRDLRHPFPRGAAIEVRVGDLTPPHFSRRGARFNEPRIRRKIGVHFWRIDYGLLAFSPQIKPRSEQSRAGEVWARRRRRETG